MDRPARLYFCAACRAQVILCSRCDRGNRYCGRQCRHQARQQARREAARRYQRSWGGRIAHAKRSRRWRRRRAERDAARGGGGDEHNVTHQGSQPEVARAPLVACPNDSTIAAAADMPTDMPTDTPAGTTAQSTPQQPAIGTLPLATACWFCRRCGQRQPVALRLGFVRHGLPAWRRHDHSP